jgi:hypothetical protein
LTRAAVKGGAFWVVGQSGFPEDIYESSDSQDGDLKVTWLMSLAASNVSVRLLAGAGGGLLIWNSKVQFQKMRVSPGNEIGPP